MRRTIFMIPALVGALGAAPAFAQSDDVVGDEDYPADDYASAPAEEAVGADQYASDQATPTYDDAGSYGDSNGDSYGDSYGDSAGDSYGTGDGTDSYSYADRTVAPEQFHTALAPYGRWIRTPEYGLVWVPSRSVVGASFVPYASNGNWRYSNAGWTFMSDWSWGWAPFHYGRWYRASRWGWVWVPGRVWAPAWVDWRYGDGYIGWAPLPPRRYAAALRYHDYWFFCSVRDMWRPHVWRYRVRSTPRLFQVAALARRPVRHGRAHWFAGPNPRVVERVVGRQIPRVQNRPNRHERVVRRVDRRQDTPRQQRVERQRIDRPQRDLRQQQAQRQQQLERQQRQQQAQRQQVERQQRQQQAQRQQVERQQRQQRVERRQFQRPERQQQRVEHQARPERQQMREQRQQQRAERQENRAAQRQQAREQHQPSRERRHHPDR